MRAIRSAYARRQAHARPPRGRRPRLVLGRRRGAVLHAVRRLPAEPAEAMDGLRSGRCDVALSLEASFEPFDDDAIAKTPLLDDPMFLVLPGDHPLAHKPNLRLEDLADEAFIQGAIGTCPDTRILLRAANAAGFEPRIAFQSNAYTAIQGFIAAGAGTGLIPDLA